MTVARHEINHTPVEVVTPFSRSFSRLLFFLLAILIVLVFLGKLWAAEIRPQASADANSVTLCWTAPGDDGYSGRATLYDLRYTTEKVSFDTAAWWEEANQIVGEPAPALSGQRQCLSLSGLEPGQTYYVALRTADEAFNWSELSNIAPVRYTFCTDINGDGLISLLDASHLIKFLYSGERLPVCGSGDIDHSGRINIADATYLINYLYREGPTPSCP